RQPQESLNLRRKSMIRRETADVGRDGMPLPVASTRGEWNSSRKAGIADETLSITACPPAPRCGDLGRLCELLSHARPAQIVAVDERRAAAGIFHAGGRGCRAGGEPSETRRGQPSPRIRN